MFYMWKVGPYNQKLLVEKKKRKKDSRNATKVGKRQ